MVAQQASARWRGVKGREHAGASPVRRAFGLQYVVNDRRAVQKLSDPVEGEPIKNCVLARTGTAQDPALVALAPKSCARARALLLGDDSSPRQLVFS